MIKGSKEYLDDVAKNYVCSDHLTPVVVAWHGGESSYVLRCGEGHFPEEVTRQLSLTEMYKSGEELPSFIEDNIKKGGKKRAMSTNKQMQSLVLGEVPRADLGTGELLVPEQVQAILHYATKYALDAYRGHVLIMYGKPYIGLDGYLYKATKSGRPHNIKSRPLTDDERKTYRVGDEDHAWICEIELLAPRAFFTGFGIVTKEEMEAKSPRDAKKLRSPVVAAHPWQLAQKRAEWQALRRAFPIGETEEVSEE